MFLPTKGGLDVALVDVKQVGECRDGLIPPRPTKGNIMKRLIFLFLFLTCSTVLASDVDGECRFHNGSYWTGHERTYITVNGNNVKLILIGSYRNIDRIVYVKKGSNLEFDGCFPVRYIDKNFVIYNVEVVNKL